jgi:hypothetical protein
VKLADCPPTPIEVAWKSALRPITTVPATLPVNVICVGAAPPP